MSIDPGRIRKHLKAFDFKALFIEELGWDHHTSTLDVTLDDRHFTLSAIAHKRGFVAYVCPLPDKQLKIDDTIRKIETHIAKTVHEHIVIYTNADRKEQIWQWARREPGKPIVRRHHHFRTDQSGESLIQKFQQMAFDLEDEERLLGITDVVGRVRAAFDVDRVTKRFYDRFKAEHDIFLKFIKGIPDEDLHRWYASVMLNRLMFIYFLQKKGLLDNNPDYLREHLNTFLQKGKDRFYVDFLCPLFFEGFAQPKPRTAKVEKLLGNVPYLNGGIFQKHQIEQSHGKAIEIPDAAFVKIFDFFDGYQWHLDERPLRDDREINPDVLGYIFEKYINQKQMGAYYTKEDITEYISKNTVIPRLFDMAKEKCKIAFEGENAVWRLCADDPDRYIYDAVKKGVDLPLPDDIADGLDTTTPNLLERRKKWNMPAAADYALPTEIWRETVTRRQRYADVRAKLAAGQIRSINDFITCNLDIRQFAQDVVETCEGPELLRAFWHAIVGRIPRKSNEKYESGITILDPTCGSGAFLFAALNILEPLYEACLERMQLFVDDLQRSDAKRGPEKYADFKAILADVQKHPSPKYFIYKSIIINNLFGVDIMEEAVEICKLRLFLKLIAQVEKEEQIEPLPDIDFNIRAGNTLVGFANLDEVKRSMEGDFLKLQELPAIEEEAVIADSAFQLFRRLQTQQKMDAGEFAEAKANLKDKLKALEDRLNEFLAGAYGITIGTKKEKEGYRVWLKSHKPFHWCVDFYNIIKNGGFDVVIGNPPYLETREVEYGVLDCKSKNSNAIHAMCIERSINLICGSGCISMIVPLALVSTQRMTIIQKILEANRDTYYANFAWRPGKLFDTVNRALTIFISVQRSERKTFSTGYQKWNSDTRVFLIPSVQYTEVPQNRNSFWVPKITSNIEQSILKKVLDADLTINDILQNSPNNIFYRTTGGLYWKVFTDFSPAFRVNGKNGHSSRETSFSISKKEWIRPIITILSSDVFWWWYTITSNLRDLNPSDINLFSFPSRSLADKSLLKLSDIYIESIVENSMMLIRQQKSTGKTETQSFKIQLSKSIIDQIDCVLAKHYGFTDEELDFIINYDTKYRMGADAVSEE